MWNFSLIRIINVHVHILFVWSFKFDLKTIIPSHTFSFFKIGFKLQLSGSDSYIIQALPHSSFMLLYLFVAAQSRVHPISTSIWVACQTLWRARMHSPFFCSRMRQIRINTRIRWNHWWIFEFPHFSRQHFRRKAG